MRRIDVHRITGHSVLRRLAEERGVALIMALGIMLVLGILGGSLVAYSTSNEKSAHRSETALDSFELAEGGVNQALAILAKPANNALINNQALLPSTEATATVDSSPGSNRTSSWYGVWTQTGNGFAQWKVVGIGTAPSPSAPGQTVVRRVRAYVSVSPTPTQLLTTDAWKYIYSKHTGSLCDVIFSGNSAVNSSIYVVGNFCLQNPASIVGPQTGTSPDVYLYVKGHFAKDQQVTVGTNPKPLTAIGLRVDNGGCWAKGWTSSYTNPFVASCGASQKVFGPVTGTVPDIPAPTADFAGWYPWAKPGPKFPCSTSSGTPPVFDNNPPLKDNSIPTVVDLTPATAYSCTMSDGSGSIAWNPATKKLTVNGTMYIDGSVTSTAGVVDYDGNAALYVSGTFLVKNAYLCAIVSSGDCDFAAWSTAANPDILVVSAEQRGTGGSQPQDQVTSGDGIEIKSAHFQGALYGQYNVHMDTSSMMQGPIVSDSAIVDNTAGSPFPIFLNVPFGTPGNPIQTYLLSSPLNETECFASTC